MGGAAITTSVLATGRYTPTSLHRRLIVNADDFGLAVGVNRGIIESVERGVVTSTSMIVNMPGWDDAIGRMAVVNVDVSVGLHFNIVAGRPLTLAPTITDPDTGLFYSLPRLASRAIMGMVNHRDVAAEFAAQLAKLRSAGVMVSHADSHRHVHALPVIAIGVTDAARECGIRVVRAPVESLGVNTTFWGATAKKIALGASWRVSSLGARTYTPSQCHEPRKRVEHFFGISLQGGVRFAERLDSVIESLPTGTSEIMVHPGYADSGLALADDYTWQRECEIPALTSPTLRARLEERSIELVNFRSVVQ